MGSSYIEYDLSIIPLLNKHGVEYSLDEEFKTLCVYWTEEKYFNTANIRESVIPYIIPLLDKPVKVVDHISELSMAGQVNDWIMITCYSDRTVERRLNYTKLAYNNQVENVYSSQSDQDGLPLPIHGVAITDDNEVEIGFIAYNRIHFFFDIFHRKITKLQGKLILDCCYKLLFMNEKLKELYGELVEKEKFNRLKEYLKRTHTYDKTTNLEQITQNVNNIAHLVKMLDEAYVQSRDLHMRKEMLDKSNPDDTIESEVNELIGTGVVMDNDNSFHLDTEEIIIKGITVGKFRIKIDLQNHTIRARNLNRRYLTYDHPHISDESICFGNIQNDVSKLLANYQVFEVMKLLKNLLYFYNGSTAYTALDNWSDEFYGK
jgi:hypothetical protein